MIVKTDKNRKDGYNKSTDNRWQFTLTLQLQPLRCCRDTCRTNVELHVWWVKLPLCCHVVEAVGTTAVIPQPGIGEVKVVWPAWVVQLQSWPSIKGFELWRCGSRGECHNTVVIFGILWVLLLLKVFCSVLHYFIIYSYYVVIMTRWRVLNVLKQKAE